MNATATQLARDLARVVYRRGRDEPRAN